MTTHHFTIETTDYKSNNCNIEIFEEPDKCKVALGVLFSHRHKLEGKFHDLLKNQDDEPLLIYPFLVADSKDLKKVEYNEDRYIMKMNCNGEGNAYKYSMETGCLMGFISATFTDETSGNDYHFNIYIHSRFDWKKSNPTIHYDGTDEKWEDKETASLGRDFFLHYMLQKVLNINVVREPSFGEDNSNLELLLYFFPAMLRRAMKQGLYRRYERREYNDARVRGPIDISRHIAKNIPFCGKIAYSTTEFDYDNSITQLVRHTIEYIAHHDWASDLLRQSDETWGDVRLIRELTADGYDPNARQRIIQSNLRLISHPFYTEWRPLQHLCLAILRYDDLRHDRANDEDRIHGLLFDGPWLWENYLWEVFQENNLGFKHPDNTTAKDGVWDGRTKRYPDFYLPIEINSENTTAREIWDGKFKPRYEKGCIDSPDRLQLMGYMYIMGNRNREIIDDNGENSTLKFKKYNCYLCETAGIVSPIPSDSCEPLWGYGIPKRNNNNMELPGLGGHLYKWHLKIASNHEDFILFGEEMKIREQEFIKQYLKELHAEK